MMGVSEEYFWHSNPAMLEPYAELYRKKQFEYDRMCHRMGLYVYEAVGSVASGFGKRPHKYPEKPFMAEEQERISIEKMSDEERLEKVESIFGMLCSTEDKVVRTIGK